MTVSSTTTKVSYSGNGSTTVFAYGFKIFADADLRVIERAADGTETVKSLTTHYTVSGAGSDSGGNVTFGTAPASGVTVIIKRNLTLTQGTDYVANDPFPAESHEEALDRLTFITQGIQEELDRAIKASETNTLTGAEFTISAADRANKVFSFDGSGNLAVTQELGTFKGDWAASTTYAVRDLVKDTSTNNIFIVTEAHTSSGSQPLTTNANSAKYSLIVDAATATTAQTAAASSASSASTSASTATTKAAEAATSATASAASATAAAASETAAAASETASAASETASAASETASAASQTAAAASATSASSSASTATTKASEASTSASTATTKASEAASSQTAAASSASSASTSAGTATTKAGEASTSATNAASSATAAASSATAAASSQTAAASSAAAAATALDSFDDRYLGVKSSNPTQDNDGNPLVSGALYFNDSANEMRVYDGANWIAATSAGNVSLILYEYTATNGQTTFSGSDDNSATLSYTVDNLQVVMNGVILDPSDFTATNGTSVVLASGAATGDLINIYAFKSFTTADMVSKTNGGTFSGAVTFDAGANFGDNDKAQFGAGNDLQIYHDGSNSYVTDQGAGDMYITTLGNAIYFSKHGTESLMALNVDGDVKLYHNNALKLATTSTGVDVTGTMHVERASSGGTAISTAALIVEGTDATGSDIQILGDDTDYQRFLFGDASDNDVGAIEYSHSNNSMRFTTNASERMRIDSSGDVLVGCTSLPSSSVAGLGIDASNDSELRCSVAGTGNSTQVRFLNPNGEVGAIRTNGTATSYLTSSDYRLKENVTADWDATTRLKQLNPVRFNFIADADTTVDGFLAHDVQSVVPEAISGTHNEVDDDGNPVYQGIDQSKLVPLLTGALKEAIAKIETLETKVAALEAGS
jgi:hypothetical protein